MSQELLPENFIFWLHRHYRTYPLARSQYINNSPGVFSCIRTRANTGAMCIRTEMNSLKTLAILRKRIPLKYSPVFARVRIQARMHSHKDQFSKKIFPARVGFVPGGNVRNRLVRGFAGPLLSLMTKTKEIRVRAKGVVLCERTCFCLLSTF